MAGRIFWFGDGAEKRVNWEGFECIVGLDIFESLGCYLC